MLQFMGLQRVGCDSATEQQHCLYGNLKKQYKCTYLQNRNRATDVENNLMVTGSQHGGGQGAVVGRVKGGRVI